MKQRLLALDVLRGLTIGGMILVTVPEHGVMFIPLYYILPGMV